MVRSTRAILLGLGPSVFINISLSADADYDTRVKSLAC